jgi:hypothetical protein
VTDAERDRRIIQVLTSALIKARERIQYEDFQGTCGCSRERDRRDLCPCEADHQDFLDMIDEALEKGG